MTSDAHNARIFVNIASYRDRECQWTVKDLFEKAENPGRIFVGICWQFDEKEDRDCFQIATRPEQVRIYPVDWREAEGVCWARHQTQQLWDGEEYTLQIDSHMRFVPGWDRLMIEELAACESQKPVISCNPASYTPPNNLQKDVRPTIRRVQPFFPNGNLRGKGEVIDRVPEKPLNGAFIAAGFVFARAEIIQEVPYDPYLYFDQEEITYAARLYTHGWDVFSARRVFLYHFYNEISKPSVRPLHWNDMQQADEKKIHFLNQRGLQRFHHLTGHTPSNDPEIIRELEKYGFGGTRSLRQFEEYCGVDFKRRVAGERALRCLFIKDLEKYRDRPIFIPEIDGKPSAPPRPKAPKFRPPPMLEPGDFVPFFELEDTGRKPRTMDSHGGRHTLLFFLPSGDEAYAGEFFRAMKQQVGGEKPDIWQTFVMDDSVKNLIALKEKLKFPQTPLADEGGKVAGAFGVRAPTGYLLDRNLKILARHMNLPPAGLAAAVLADCRRALEKDKQKSAAPRVITETAPAVIIPRALTPELCAKCIHAFRTGKTFEGTVGAEKAAGYQPNAKVRTDYILSGALLAEIDEKLSRSVYPEIEKAFGFEVTRRELFKIGLYTGKKGGFFKQHRDNFEIPLGYRRVAMTIHLSDDYEGGGLKFPEYGDDVYKPAKGAAIAFSASLMHEALPVTQGERYIIVAFVHGEEDEAFRRHYVEGKGVPLNSEHYTPQNRNYAAIRRSRDFMRKWRKEHIRYEEKP